MTALAKPLNKDVVIAALSARPADYDRLGMQSGHNMSEVAGNGQNG